MSELKEKGVTGGGCDEIEARVSKFEEKREFCIQTSENKPCFNCRIDGVFRDYNRAIDISGSTMALHKYIRDQKGK